MFNQTLEDIRAARKLIENPENWTKGAWARDKQGASTSVNDPIACAFCSVGAINRTVGYDTLKPNRAADRRAALAAEELSIGVPYGIISFNDDHNHEAVLAHFDKTIARLLAA